MNIQVDIVMSAVRLNISHCRADLESVTLNQTGIAATKHLYVLSCSQKHKEKK